MSGMIAKRPTSEAARGLMEQPKPTCPTISNVVLRTRRMNQRLLIELRRNPDTTRRVEALNMQEHIEKRCDEIRENVVAIRAWGEQWKRLALKLEAELRAAQASR